MQVFFIDSGASNSDFLFRDLFRFQNVVFPGRNNVYLERTNLYLGRSSLYFGRKHLCFSETCLFKSKTNFMNSMIFVFRVRICQTSKQLTLPGKVGSCQKSLFLPQIDFLFNFIIWSGIHPEWSVWVLGVSWILSNRIF